MTYCATFTLLDTNALRIAAPPNASIKQRTFAQKAQFDATVYNETSLFSICGQTFPVESDAGDSNALSALQQCMEAVVHVMIRVSHCIGKPSDRVFDLLQHVTHWSRQMWKRLTLAEGHICRCCESKESALADSLLLCVKAADSCTEQIKEFVDRVDSQKHCSFAQDSVAFARGIGHVNCAAFGEAADHAVFGLKNGTVRLWLGRGRYVIYGHFESGVEKVSFSPDFALVVAQANDGVVMVWDTSETDMQER